MHFIAVLLISNLRWHSRLVMMPELLVILENVLWGIRAMPSLTRHPPGPRGNVQLE